MIGATSNSLVDVLDLELAHPDVVVGELVEVDGHTTIGVQADQLRVLSIAIHRWCSHHLA